MRSITWIAVCAVVCLTVVAVSDASATEVKFDKVEYFPPKSEGQKKSSEPVKGHVTFDKEQKVIEFQDSKGQMIVTIPYDKIKSLLYEKTSRPRYIQNAPAPAGPVY
jgi:hypothetical protein